MFEGTRRINYDMREPVSRVELEGRMKTFNNVNSAGKDEFAGEDDLIVS